MNTTDKKRKNFTIGEKVLIRTVTYASVGRVDGFNRTFVWLKDSSWIADTGRYGRALATGELEEVERCPGIRRIAIGAIVDIDQWGHDLPAETK